jgi:DNA-binding response OmpR family regulator
MTNSTLTISIFGNKIFSEILNEMKLFSEYKIEYYENLNLCVRNAEEKNQLVVFFVSEINKNFFNEIKKNKYPLIFVGESSVLKNILSVEFSDQLNMPFTILDFKKKVITAIAKNEFKKNSLIHLGDYIIDKNVRKIKKNNLELQLSEKEINFLVLFSKNKKPISRNLVLKNVWNYSAESETHTVETHIHRLRKKILEKFGDNNFIKNDNKGYYI